MSDEMEREFGRVERPEPVTLDEAKAQITELEAELEKALFEAGVLRLQLDMLSSTDTLTGMPNLNGVAQALEKAAARADRSAEPFGLMAIEIPVLEKLREIEPDEHEDAVRHAGAMITACLRRLDTVGRLEEGAFLIVLPMLGPEGVKAVTHRSERLLLQTPVMIGDDALRLTPAFTIVLSNPDGANEPHRMLKELTAAMPRSRPGRPVILHTKTSVD
jgi:GGDEF domain-containing protein